MRVDLEHVLLVPGHILGAPRLGADIVLREDAARGEDQREGAVGALRRRHEFGDHEAALAAHEAADMHERRSLRRLVVARPLDGAQRVELGEGDAGEGRRHARDLVHDLGGIVVVHGIAHGGGEFADHLPLLLALHRRLHLAHAVDAALGVGEGAVLLEEGGAGQEDMGEGGGLVQEQVLHDDAFHGFQRMVHVLGVGVRLGDVLALHEEALEACLRRRHRTCWECAGPARCRGGSATPSRTSGAPCRRRHGGSPRTRAGRSPCRRSPAHCSVHGADSRRRRCGPTLPVAMARLAMPMTMVEPWLCSVTPRP